MEANELSNLVRIMAAAEIMKSVPPGDPVREAAKDFLLKQFGGAGQDGCGCEDYGEETPEFLKKRVKDLEEANKILRDGFGFEQRENANLRKKIEDKDQYIDVLQGRVAEANDKASKLQAIIDAMASPVATAGAELPHDVNPFKDVKVLDEVKPFGAEEFARAEERLNRVGVNIVDGMKARALFANINPPAGWRKSGQPIRAREMTVGMHYLTESLTVVECLAHTDPETGVIFSQGVHCRAVTNRQHKFWPRDCFVVPVIEKVAGGPIPCEDPDHWGKGNGYTTCTTQAIVQGPVPSANLVEDEEGLT